MKSLLLLPLCALSLCHATAYSHEKAVRAMRFYQATHCDEVLLETWTCGDPCIHNYNIEEVEVFQNETKGSKGYFAYNPELNEISIAFRGSANAPNFISDFDFIMETQTVQYLARGPKLQWQRKLGYKYGGSLPRLCLPGSMLLKSKSSGKLNPLSLAISPSPVKLQIFRASGYNQRRNSSFVRPQGCTCSMEPYEDLPHIQVHTGFYEAFKNVREQIFEILQRKLAEHPSASILVLGHSYGAALATFCALELKTKLDIKQKMDVYIFGSPRTGNPAWAAHVNSILPDIFRVVHYNDIVPHLPLLDLGFRHVGLEIWYHKGGDDMTYQECPAPPGELESKECSHTVIVTSVLSHLHYFGLPTHYSCPSYSTML